MKAKNVFWFLVAVALAYGIFYYTSQPRQETQMEENKTQPTEETIVDESTTRTEDNVVLEDESMEEEDEGEEEDTTSTEKETTTPALAGFTLSAEALGNGEVKFTWSVPEEAEEAGTAKYIIVRSEEENPIHDGKNYWIRLHQPKGETTWDEQPTGTHHYRMCVTLDKMEDQCGDKYSNDVEVDVK